jgi:hypothetical protein
MNSAAGWLDWETVAPFLRMPAKARGSSNYRVPQLTLRIWLGAERRRSLTISIVAHFFQGD